MRTLTLSCPSGLANRIRMLTSGRALAEATGRQMRMMWPVNTECSASFRSLFLVDDWPVEEGDPATESEDFRVYVRLDALPEIMRIQQEHLRIRSGAWLVARNRMTPSHVLYAATMRYLDALLPVPEMAAQIDDFQRRHFRPYMIGVHLRRGDFVAVRPHVAGNTDQAMACVDQVLLQEPDAGILLCTDDGELRPDGTVTPKEGVVEKFRNRYGERVVLATAREAGNARDSHAALFDLVLLRRTQAFVGTYSSSFSDVASVGRDIPKWFVAGGVESYRRFDALLRYSGMQALLMARDRRIHGTSRDWYIVRWEWERGMSRAWQKVRLRLGRS